MSSKAERLVGKTANIVGGIHKGSKAIVHGPSEYSGEPGDMSVNLLPEDLPRCIHIDNLKSDAPVKLNLKRKKK